MLLALKWLSNYKNNFGITGLTTVVAEDDAACNLAWVLERDDVNESMFQKVVLLNGGNLYADRGVPSDVVRKYSARLLKKIDCHVPSFQQAADCLRTKSVGDIKNSLDLIGFEEIDGIPFKPYSENKIAPQIKKEYIGLIGIGKKLMDEYKGDNEFSVDYSYADFKLFLHRLINEMENNNAALVRRIILHHYIYSRGDKMDTYYLWRASRRLLHHKLLAVPLRKMIFEDLMANKNNKIWLFEHESVNPLDTCYTINPKNNMVDFCAKLNDYISGMVIRGQPTDSSANSSNPVFPQLGTSKENYYLQLKEGGSIELDSPFYQKPMALFNSLIPFLNKLDLVGKRVPMVDAYADLLQDTTLTNLYQDDDYQRWNEEEHDEL
uniref:COesterase domain-containing protein n=1 Tax=Rhabditophanes sp. KR3021 TaxID=114890 RepID=A0AC35U5D6_9BILA